MGIFNGLARASHALLAPTLRKWDLVSANRPDHYIAISSRVKKRIEKYYRRDADVIYPPVDVHKFQIGEAGEYFLTVSRLVGYKRVDIVVEAFTKLGLPLVIIGDGLQKSELKANAGSNITFVDRHLTDSELVDYYQNCRAFVYAGEEDFGIVAVEASSCGKPVIAYRESGIAEVVRDGVTGFLFAEQTVSSLVSAVKKLAHHSFDADVCRSQAERFSQKRFFNEMKKSVERLYRTHQL